MYLACSYFQPHHGVLPVVKGSLPSNAGIRSSMTIDDYSRFNFLVDKRLA